MRKRESVRRSSFVVSAGLIGLLTACGADRGSGGGGGAGAGGGGGAASIDGGVVNDGGVLGEIPGLKSIRVDPPTAMVSTEKGKPATVQFKAFGTFDGKPEREITAEVSWRSEDPGRAQVDKTGLATTASNVGGLTLINASSGFIRGQAKLIVKYTEAMVDTGVVTPVPAETPTKFGAAPVDATRSPQLVYPPSGVLLPPNLAGIEIHFKPTVETNKLFEVQFTSPYLDLRVYTRCQAPATIAGCIYVPSAEAWRVLASANRGGGDVQVVVRGMDEAGTAKGESTAVTMGFSRDEILGAVYYWSTKEEAVKRWDFGSTTQKTADTVVNGGTFGGKCPGCHALARDGSKLVLSTNGQRDGRLLLFDLKTNKPAVPYPLAQRSQFEAWNPTGSQFVGVFGDVSDVSKNPGYGSLLFFDGVTGALQSMIKPTPYMPDHPDWSPDGKRIVFTTVGQHNTDQMSYKGGLAYMTSEATGWSTAKELLPPVPGKNRYYPAISPTNDFIAFNESTCPPGKQVDADCNFDMDTTSKLWGLYLQGGQMPVEFVNANKPGLADGTNTAITNSYPKWSPFVFQLDEERKLLWMTFTSRRAYGLRGSKVLLWMVGIEPGALTAGKDPSFAAFALPFQELESSNHIGQWTSKIPDSE